ncbi:PRC-barrel domain-containing protein [Microbacterium chocolatum]|uniref:PRC-barrel domain-containing protein n=1 Tax=Microbacterium aurantiacum TaxID=162393 RepID=UPI00338FEF8C
MNDRTNETLRKLGDLDETVANPDEDVRGRSVRDQHGEDIGTVKDLLVDEAENRIRFLEVASGGFLGIGREITLLPVDAITAITDDEVRVDPTRERIAGAPEYDPRLVQERHDYGNYLDYYGYGAWWGPGYAYPTFPYYR